MFGLAILALVAFLIFRLMTGSGATTTLVTVPDFVGKQFAEAQSLAQQSGLQVVQAQNIQSSDKPAGSVAAQDPPANSQVTSGSTIKLTVVTGNLLVIVPNLVGQTEQAAIAALIRANLEPGPRTDDFDPQVPAGSVSRQYRQGRRSRRERRSAT